MDVALARSALTEGDGDDVSQLKRYNSSSLLSALGASPPFFKENRLPAHEHRDGNYDWLVHRIGSGEAVALLSLSGNTAISATPSQIGMDVSYTVRGKATSSAGQHFLEQLTE